MPPLLRLRGLAKSYDGNAVLTGIDLDLEPGEILALVGENGALKSTLMRIVAGFAAPSTGEVTYDGSSRPGTVSRLRPIDESSDSLAEPSRASGASAGRSRACPRRSNARPPRGDLLALDGDRARRTAAIRPPTPVSLKPIGLTP